MKALGTRLKSLVNFRNNRSVLACDKSTCHITVELNGHVNLIKPIALHDVLYLLELDGEELALLSVRQQ